MAQLKVRRMEPDEVEQTVAVWERSRWESLPALERRMGYTHQDSLRFFRETLMRENDLWVADSGGRVVGLLAVRGSLVDRLYVEPGWQRRGVGRALLEKARELSPTELRLFTLQRNRRASRFYEARGFRVEALGVSPPPESEPDVLYVWRADGGAKGKLLGRGGSADVYEWAPGRVLKLFRPAYAHAVDVEARKARAVHAAGIDAPATYDTVSLEERRGIVYERVDGPLLFERLGRGEQAVAEVGALLARLHAELHTHRIADLDDLVEVSERAAESLPEPERAAHRARLAALPRGTAVCHGDFHPGNVIMGRVPILIDWVNAVSAHPAVDVARSSTLMRFQGLAKGAPSEKSVRVRQVVTDAYVGEYLSITSVTADEVARAEPMCAAALLRHDPDNPERDQLGSLAAV